MNPTSTRQKIKDLKTKMNNLELEVRSLIQGAEFEPGTIDAVHQDISNFTDEIRDINKQLLNLKNKPKNEALSLMNVYESMVKENNPNFESKFNGKTGNEWIQLFKNIPYDELIEWAELSQHNDFRNLLLKIKNKNI